MSTHHGDQYTPRRADGRSPLPTITASPQALVVNRDFRVWLIYSACCLVAFLDFAIIMTFGTLFVKLLDKYGESRSATAAVQSLLIGTTTTSSVICGVFIRKLGVSWSSVLGTILLSAGFIFSFFATKILVLDALIGVLSGIGISLLYVSSAVIVRDTFEGTTREIALSGHTIAIGLGAIAYPYILSLLEESYGINGTLLILGGLYLNNIAVTQIFHIHEKENSMKKQTQNDISSEREDPSESVSESKKHNTILKYFSHQWEEINEMMSLNYTIVLVGSTIVLSALNGYMILYNDILTSKGFSSDAVLKQFTSLNVGSTVARIVPIILSKVKPGADHIMLLILFSMCGCVGQLLIYFATDMSMAYPGNILSGATAGGGTCAAIVVIGNVAPEALFGVALGLFLTVMGILTLALGPLYGYIRDSSQSYSMAMFLTCGLSVFATGLFTIALIKNMCQIRVRRTRKYEMNTSQTTK